MNTYDVILGDAKLGDAVMRTQIPGLDVVPSLLDLSAAEVELVERPRREYRLKEALAGADKDYDYVLIDCPPSLGLLTVIALVAAKSILVPLQCEFFALEGLSLLLRTVDRVRRTFNPDLEVQGVLLTMFDRRNNLAQQVATDAQLPGQARLRHGYSAQRARVRGAVPRHARVAVRFSLPWGPGIRATRQRSAAARADRGSDAMNELGAEPRVGARKRGLGMGLSALLARRDRANAEGVHMVPIEFLRPAALQPRRYFGEDELAALTESIRARGVMQPLLVRRLPDGDDQ